MSEIIDNKQVFTLTEVMKSIHKTLSDRYKSSYWIKAEMNKLNYYKQSGHCYPELVEKQDGKIVTQIRSTLWRDNYININNNFLKVLKEPLKDGIKILINARITFDISYGLALNIIDIDPAYTLGDLEREKQETIKKLKEEGIYYKNKALQLPLLPKRIAVISVETSKGYSDFLNVIEGNAWDYKFFHLLFPSLLQGEKAVDGIIKQLQRIKKVKSHFDVVAIIRGGGGDIGLSCYNDYNLSREIAMFPLPVITGIGHSTNETVAEMISFANAITPTKLAEYLIQKFHNFSVPVQKAEEKIISFIKRKFIEVKQEFNSEIKLFRSVTGNILLRNKSSIKELSLSVSQQAKFIFKSEQESLFDVAENIRKGSAYVFKARFDKILLAKEKLADKCKTLFNNNNFELNMLEKSVSNMNPENVLKRGYSITLLNGKAVKDAVSVKEGDKLETKVYKGKIISIVESVKKK